MPSTIVIVLAETVVVEIGNERIGKACVQPVTGVPFPVHTDRKVPDPALAPLPVAPRLIPSMPQNELGIIKAGVPTPEEPSL